MAPAALNDAIFKRLFVDERGRRAPHCANRSRSALIGGPPREPHVILLVQDLDIRVTNAATGELLRELVLDPTRDYRRTAAPKGPTRTTRK